jgi:DNA gyrase subunit A
MFITNKGRLLWLKGYKIPEGSRQSKGKPMVNILGDLEEGEYVVNTMHASDFPDDKYLVFCTRNGLFKKTVMSAYGNVRSRGIKAIKLDEGDELVETSVSSGDDQIILASATGLAVRFDETDVRPMGRDTMGVKGMTLNPGDRVISMAVVKPGDRLLTVSENGYGKISEVDDYRQTRRGGKGVITIKTDERNGNVVSVRKVESGDQLMVNSKSGKIIRINTDEIRETGRNAKGVRIMDMRDGDKIIAVHPISCEPETQSSEPVPTAAPASLEVQDGQSEPDNGSQ